MLEHNRNLLIKPTIAPAAFSEPTAGVYAPGYNSRRGSPLGQASRDFGAAAAEDKVVVRVVDGKGVGEVKLLPSADRWICSVTFTVPAKLPSGLKVKNWKVALNVPMPVRCHVPSPGLLKAGELRLPVMVTVPP